MSKAGADPSGRRDPDAPDRRRDGDREPRRFDFGWRTVAAFLALLLLNYIMEREESARRRPRRDGSKFLVLSPAMAPRITPRSAP
jgi:hypothetical protein